MNNENNLNSVSNSKILFIIKKNEEKQKNKSSRMDYITLRVETSLIQKIVRNLVNNGEIEEKNKLKSLESTIIKKYKNIRDLEIGEVYKNEINEKIKKNRSINKEIIDKAVGNKKIKFTYTLQEIYNIFYDSNLKDFYLIKIMPEFEKFNELEKMEFIERFYEGLEEVKEFIKKEKINDEEYNKNLLNVLKKLFKK